MSGGPGAVNWGGDEINLRAAGQTETSGAQLIQAGLTGGTETLAALSVTAPDNMELLAVEYWVTVSSVLAAQDPVPALAARVADGTRFLVTTQEDHGADSGFGRELEAGDYFQGHVLASPSWAMEDETNGVGGGGGGQMGTFHAVHDPGFDSETGPLFIREGDVINVHLLTLNAIGADDEVKIAHRLTAYWDEIEEFEETEVRTQFPSREGTII